MAGPELEPDQRRADDGALDTLAGGADLGELDRSDGFQWHQLNAFDMTIRRAGRVSSVGSGKSRVPDSTYPSLR